jgi:hypothetical protein
MAFTFPCNSIWNDVIFMTYLLTFEPCCTCTYIFNGGIRDFSKGGVPPLRFVFKGGGSTIIFGFQRGAPLSKTDIFTLF